VNKIDNQVSGLFVKKRLLVHTFENHKRRQPGARQRKPLHVLKLPNLELK
jgi:hypothetical protein